MSLATITRDIINGDYSNDELNKIAEAIKFARGQITKQNRRSLVVGTQVKFIGKRGQTVVGKVEKVNIKFIIVRENRSNALGDGVWKVPASMLTAV
jgi:hypothetical protein